MSDDYKTVVFDEASNFPCTAFEEMRGKLVTGEPEQEELTMEEDVVDDFLTLENDGERLVLEAGDEQLVLADSEFHSKRDIRDFESNVRNVLETMAYTVADRLRSKFSELRQEEKSKNYKLLAFLREVYKKIADRQIEKIKQVEKYKFDFLRTVAADALKSLRQKLELNEQYLQASRRQVESLEKDVANLTNAVRPAIYVLDQEPYKFSYSGPGWVVVDATWERGPLHRTQGAGFLATASSIFPPTVFASKGDAQKAIADTKNYKTHHAWCDNTYVAVQIVK
jgi:hypothetical protein